MPNPKRKLFTYCTYPWARRPEMGAYHLYFFRMIKRGITVPKPKGLDLNTTYVRTDIMILKTLLLHFPRLAEKSNTKRATRLVVEDIGQVTTAYLTTAPVDAHIREYDEHRSTPAARLQLTKKETEKILEGYPPYYAETSHQVNGSKIQPIRSKKDIYRGGWIVAVGLSHALPTAFHRMKGRAGKESRVPKALRKAFARVVHGLKTAENAFPEERYIHSATDCVKTLASCAVTSKGHSEVMSSEISRQFSRFWNDQDPKQWLSPSNKEFAASLSDEQCRITIGAFNHYEQFSPEEIAALSPILMIVSRAILVGSYQISKYLKGQPVDKKREELEERLDRKQAPIYLRAWKEGNQE